MIDQHIHTLSSPDSEETIENYLKKAAENNDEYLTITDHFDILENLAHLMPWQWDCRVEIAKQYENFDFSNEFVKLGIEVGYNDFYKQEIITMLNQRNYSLVLLSVHELDSLQIKLTSPETYLEKGITHAEVVHIYFDYMKKAVNSGIDYDILTHMGYPFRYVASVDYNDYFDIIEDILKAIIKDKRILEINTGCMRYNKYDTHDFYTKLLKLYKQLGGEKVALNSDAHVASDYNAKFSEAILLIKDVGFDKLVVVKDRVHTFVSI